MATPLAKINQRKALVDEFERLLAIRLDEEAYYLFAHGSSRENDPSWSEMTSMTRDFYRNEVNKAVDDLMGLEKTWNSIREEYNLPDNKERFQEIVRLTYSIQEARMDFSDYEFGPCRGYPYWYPSLDVINAARDIIATRAMNAAPAEPVDPKEEKDEDPVKKVDQGKKRPNESASKTPVSSKKSKNATPEKTGMALTMQARLNPDSHDARLHFDTAAVYLKRAFCQDPSNPAYQISLEQADAKVHEQIRDSQWSSAAAAATEFLEQIHGSQWPATKVLERHTEIVNHGLGQQSKGSSSARKVPQCSIGPFVPSQDSIAVVDRISELPDELLCRILSFLPTKFSFTTTLLSKRWTPLFYSLPVLHFNDVNFKDFQTYDRFCNFVDNLMIHPLSINQAHPLKKFRFNQCYRRHRRNLFARKKDIHNINAGLEVAPQLPREKDIHIINTWLEVLIQRRVEEFDLKLYFHTLKPIIFISETLTILKLSTLKVGNDTSCVNLPSLKSLNLKQVGFKSRNDYINFLSSCPNLEYLHVRGIGCMERAKNNAPETVFKKSLVLSKLVRMSIESEDALFKVISMFPNLIHIKLRLNCRHCWDDVVELLRLCPKLQILYVKKRKAISSKKKETISSGEWKYPFSVLECVSYHLKSCTILTSDYEGWANDICYVQYILRNARLLQDMTINFYEIPSNRMLLEKGQIIEELSSCPKISSGCKLSFELSYCS